MTDSQRLRYLRFALVAVGVTFIAGIYLLMIVWPSGWTWHTGHSDYPLMIVGVYAVLGVYLIAAARNPSEQRSLISFTVWSSVVHAGIMAAQAIYDGHEIGHLDHRFRSSNHIRRPCRANRSRCEPRGVD